MLDMNKINAEVFEETPAWKDTLKMVMYDLQPC